MPSLRRAAFGTLAVALVPAIVGAQIVNPGFEVPPTLPGAANIHGGGANLGGWQVVGPSNAIFLVNTSYAEPANGMAAFQAHGGMNSVDLSGPGNTGTASGIQQMVPTIGGSQYLLSFFVGRALSRNGSGFYTGNPVIDVSIDGGPRVSFVNSNAGASGFVDWQQFGHQFTASGPSTLITFFNGNASSNVNEAGLDDVSIALVATAAPEPATIVLVAGALPLLAWAARRRRRG